MSEPPSVFAELALETGWAVLANSLGRGLDRNKSDERQRPPEAGQGRQSAGSEVTPLWSRSHRPAWNSQAGPGFFFLPRLFMNNGCLAGGGREMPAKPPLALVLQIERWLSSGWEPNPWISHVLRQELLTSSPHVWRSPSSNSPVSDGRWSRLMCVVAGRLFLLPGSFLPFTSKSPGLRGKVPAGPRSRGRWQRQSGQLLSPGSVHFSLRTVRQASAGPTST